VNHSTKNQLKLSAGICKPKAHIAFYCHFLFGLGHISRTTAIANALLENYPDSACTIFTDEMRDVDFFIHSHVDIIELPRVSAPTTEINEEITRRSDKIISFLDKHTVSVFLTDHLPFGVYGELIKVLRQNIVRNWNIRSQEPLNIFS
jgi:predicted glycosyltransferase